VNVRSPTGSEAPFVSPPSETTWGDVVELVAGFPPDHDAVTLTELTESGFPLRLRTTTSVGTVQVHCVPLRLADGLVCCRVTANEYPLLAGPPLAASGAAATAVAVDAAAIRPSRATVGAVVRALLIGDLR
jgi:hypothetical protein